MTTQATPWSGAGALSTRTGTAQATLDMLEDERLRAALREAGVSSFEELVSSPSQPGALQPTRAGQPQQGLGQGVVAKPGPMGGGPPVTLEALGAGLSGTGGPTTAQQELASLQGQGITAIGTGDWRRQAGIAGIGLLGQLGQYALATQKTAAEKANEARLAELQRLERQGMLGLSPQEYYRYQRAVMDPIRAQTRDVVRSGEATAAGQTGVSRSAAQLVRGQREGFRQLRETGIKGGQMLTDADVKRAALQRQEIGERIAYEGKMDQQRQNLQAQLLGSVAQPIGQMAASYQKTQMTPGLWEGMVKRYGADEAKDLAEMMRGMSPGQRSRFASSIQTYIKDAG